MIHETDLPEPDVVREALHRCAEHLGTTKFRFIDGIVSDPRLSQWVGPANRAPVNYVAMAYIIRKLKAQGVVFFRYGYSAEWTNGYREVCKPIVAAPDLTNTHFTA